MQLKGPPTVTINGIKYPVTLAAGACNFKRPDEVKFVYVIATGQEGPAISKVGIARDVTSRLAALQSCSPVKLKAYYEFEVCSVAAEWVEQTAHDTLHAVHTHNEWFQCTPAQAASAVRLALKHVVAVERFFTEAVVRNSKRWREIVEALPKDNKAWTNAPPSISALCSVEQLTVKPIKIAHPVTPKEPIAIDMQDVARRAQSVMEYAERLKALISS